MIKKMTLKDVAEKAGVSLTTASITLRNGPDAKRFSKKTIDHINSVVKELDYRPDFFASQIRSSSRKILALAVTTFQDIGAGTSAEGFEQRAAERGYKTMVSIIGRREDGFFDCDIIGKHGVSAIAAITKHSKQSDRLVDKLAKEGVKIVLIGRNVENKLVSSVLVDDYAGATQAAKYIYDKSVKNVWVICRPFVSEVYKTKRVLAFQDYARQLGRPEPKLILVPAMPSSRETARESYNVIREKLSELGPPEAIFGINDMLVYPVFRALNELGYQAGKDVAVVGYGDLWPSEFTSSAMTTVRVPHREMGTSAADVLIDMLENKIQNGRKIVLCPELVVRNSAL